VTCATDTKAHYYPGAGTFVTKLVADKESHALLGIQVVGNGAVDKMVDIAVTGISMKAKIEDFDTMDFAYAPPFSTAIHPFAHVLNVLKNKMAGNLESMTPAQYAAGEAVGYRIFDASLKPTIEGAPYIDLPNITGPIDGVGKDEKVLLVCNKGKRAYLVQNRLKAFGYTNTKVLEGGNLFTDVTVD
jgi:rhodanese-related sulfurtransferase